MKKVILICVLIAGVLVSAGCSGSRVKAPERVFDVLCELRPEPEDEIAEVLLNNTYALFSVSG